MDQRNTEGIQPAGGDNGITRQPVMFFSEPGESNVGMNPGGGRNIGRRSSFTQSKDNATRAKAEAKSSEQNPPREVGHVLGDVVRDMHKLKLPDYIKRANSSDKDSHVPTDPVYTEDVLHARNVTKADRKHDVLKKQFEDEQIAADKVSLQALGFKTPWKLMNEESKKGVVIAQLEKCATTLGLMDALATQDPDGCDDGDCLACRSPNKDELGVHEKVFGVLDNNESLRQAPFMLLNADDYTDASACIPLVQLMIEYMGMKPPLLVVSFHGATEGTAIKQLAQVEEIIKTAVTELDRVWFISSGLGDGVSALVAKAVDDFRKLIPGGADSSVMPMIGIVPWSDVPPKQRKVIRGVTPDRMRNINRTDPVRTSYPKAGKGGCRIQYVPQQSDSLWPDLDHNHTHFFFVTSRMSTDATATIRLWKDIEDAMKEKVFYFDQIKKWYKRFSSNGTQSATYNVINSGYFCEAHRKRVGSHMVTRVGKHSAKECKNPKCLPASCIVARAPRGGAQMRGERVDAIPQEHTLLLNATRLPLTSIKMFTKSTFPKGAAKIWKNESDGIELELVGDFRAPNGKMIPGSPVDIMDGGGIKHGRVKAVKSEADKSGIQRVVTADVYVATADGTGFEPEAHGYKVEVLRIRSHFEVTQVKPWSNDVRDSSLTEEAGLLIEHTGEYADGFLACYAPRYDMLLKRNPRTSMETFIFQNRDSGIFKRNSGGHYPQWHRCPEITLLNGYMGFGDEIHMDYNPDQVYQSKIQKGGNYDDSGKGIGKSSGASVKMKETTFTGGAMVHGGPEKRQSISTAMYGADSDTGKEATGIFSDANEQDHFLEHTTHVNVVKVVVGGGEKARWRTMQTNDVLMSMEAAVRNIDDGCPIVLLDGSGGLVDLLCKAWRLLHCTGALSARIQRQELETMTRKVFSVYDPKKADILLTRVFNVVAVDTKVVIFDVNGDNANALDQCVLNALVQNMRPNYNRSDLEVAPDGNAKSVAIDDIEGERLQMRWWSGRDNWVRRQEHLQSYELHLNALRICLLVDRVPEATVELHAAQELWDDMMKIWADFKSPDPEDKDDAAKRNWKTKSNSEYFRRYHLQKFAETTEGEKLAPSNLKGRCRCVPEDAVQGTAADCRQSWWCCIPDTWDNSTCRGKCSPPCIECASSAWATNRVGGGNDLEHYEEKMMLDFWYDRSEVETKQHNLLHTNRIMLTFKEHVELALEWALADDRLEQVQMLKPLIDDFPKFLYDRKTCRAEEGFGTTLAELYEYEDDPKLTEYLEPLLEFKKKEPTFGGKTLHASDSVAGGNATIQNVQEINDVRLRRVWSLVLQLLYDDDDMEAPEDEHFPFEESEAELKKLGYRSARKFAHTHHDKKCPLCELSLLEKLSPSCGSGTTKLIKKSDQYAPVNGKSHDDWNHRNVHSHGVDDKEKTPNNKKGRSIDVTIDRTLQSVWELVCQKRAKTTSASKKNHADLLANQEMMIWAVLMCRYDMAVFFWQEGGYAIPNALLASRLFLGMAEHNKLTSKGRLADRVAQMHIMAEKFEALAIGCLAKCYEENADTSQDVLEAELTPYDWMGRVFPGRDQKNFDDSMQLAFLAKNMDFIDHVACQAVIDRKWRGGRAHSVKHTADGTLIPPKYDVKQGARYGFGFGFAVGASIGAAIGTVFFPDAAEMAAEVETLGQNATAAPLGIGSGLVYKHGIGIGAGAVGLFFGIFGALLGGKVIKKKWNWPVIINRISAPKIKYFMDFGQTLLMVLLQSYIVLGDLSIKGNMNGNVGNHGKSDLATAMFYEHILAAWILVLIAEEIRQTFDDGWNYVYFKRWSNDVWNRMDVVIYIVFVVTYTMRLSRYESGDALLYKGLYATNCLLSWMRIFKYAGASEGLGPKVIILGELVGSLMQYMMLLAVFIISFGIFTEAIANPAFPLGGNRGQHGSDWEVTMHNVLYRPYFQMYGELMLEDISSETKCLGAPFTDCSSLFESVVLPLATGLYMIVTSLMLMNMLIADFTLTFEAQFEESGKIFKMERFKLLTEYDSKPWLPVPFSAFHICGRFVLNLPQLWTVISNFSCCSCCPGKPPCESCLECFGQNKDSPEETADQVEEDRRIEDFQDRCCDTFLAAEDKDAWESVECRVARIEEEMMHAKDELAFFKGKSYSAGLRSGNLAAEMAKMKSENEDFPMYPRCTIDSTLEALNEVKFRDTRISKDPSGKTWRRLHTDEKLRELMKLEQKRDEKQKQQGNDLKTIRRADSYGHFEDGEVDNDDPMKQLQRYHGDVGKWCIIRGAFKNNNVYQGMASQVADTETNRMLDISIYAWTTGAKLGRRCSFYQEVAMDTELGMCNQSRCGCRSVRRIGMKEGRVTTFDEAAGRKSSVTDQGDGQEEEDAVDGHITAGPMCRSENPGCRYRAFERYDQSFCLKSDDASSKDLGKKVTSILADASNDHDGLKRAREVVIEHINESHNCTCGRRHEVQQDEAHIHEDMQELKTRTGLNVTVIEERNPLPNPFQFYEKCKTCQFQDRNDVRKGIEGLTEKECLEATGCERSSFAEQSCKDDASKDSLKKCVKPHPHSKSFTEQGCDAAETNHNEKIHIMRKIAPAGRVNSNGEWIGYKEKGRGGRQSSSQKGGLEEACVQNHTGLWDGIEPVDKHGMALLAAQQQWEKNKESAARNKREFTTPYPDAYFLRGTLPELGRNHFIAHIVTRWKKDDMGIMIDRGGKKLMQFVGFKRHLEDNQWSIPSLLMNRKTEKRDRKEEDTKQTREEEEMRDNLKKAQEKWNEVKKDIEVDKGADADADATKKDTRCDTIKKMLEDDQSSKYYERPATMTSEDLAPWWDEMIKKYQEGYTAFKLAKVQYNEAKAAPSDDCRGIEKRFNKGFSACAHHAFHKKNFKTTVSPPQQKFVEDQMKILFDAQYSTGMSRRNAPYVGKMIYEGFMDDERNFGKAYSFVTVFITHDEEGVLDAYNLASTATDAAEVTALRELTKETSTGEDEGEFDIVIDNKRHPAPAEAAWLTMHRDLDLTGEEEDLLEHVAKIHNAYW